MDACGRCGSTVVHAAQSLGCLECGAPCCPTCAVYLESVAYCRPCAGWLLAAPAIRSGNAGGLC
jgi:hypothetical protein